MMIGKIINKYRIDAKLGEGGMGIIYKAWDTILERPVALKMLLPALAQDEKFLQRFRTEAKALAQLENPHIVTVFELLEVEGDWFIAMQFIEGMTLADKIKQTGPIPCTQALPIFTQLLDAMGHAHQVGIIHRDLKPGNAMITPAGVVKVMDFGLAKVQHGSILTLSTITAGTLHYMPPEQIHNLANVDQRSDIYSTGMTFYEMLAGRLPFEKHESIYTLPKIIVEGKFPPPDYYHSAVPKELAKIVMKAIAKNPAKRYQKAEEMLEALANFEAARAPAVSPPQPKPRSGTKLLYAIFSSAIVLALAVLFLLLFPDLPQRLSNFGGRPMPDTVTTKSATEADTIVSSPPETEAVTDGQTIKSAAQVGSVRIVSQPSRADILLNNQPRGKTPSTLKDLAPDDYTIVLKKDGYQNFSRFITLEAGEKEEVNAALVPLMGKLRVLIKPSGVIYINGEPKRPNAADPYETSLPIGSHRLKLECPGLGFLEKTVTITTDQLFEIDFDFNRKAILTVASKPWGEIWVDGDSIGTRTIEVRRKGYKLEGGARTINLEGDLKEPLEFTLKKIE